VGVVKHIISTQNFRQTNICILSFCHISGSNGKTPEWRWIALKRHTQVSHIHKNPALAIWKTSFRTWNIDIGQQRSQNEHNVQSWLLLWLSVTRTKLTVLEP
jgi:hypothetical protein